MAPSVVVVGETAIPPPGPVATVAIQVQDDGGTPIAGAQATANDVRMVSDGAGLVHVRWEGVPVSVSIEAEGFFPAAIAVDGYHDDPLDLALRPVVLRGVVLDPGGFGLVAASVSLGEAQVVTDRSGRFEISRASAGTITVTRPGWYDNALVWDGGTLVEEIRMEPQIIRGLHVAFSVHAEDEQWQDLLAVAKDTVVNAFVIDVKDESGLVGYDTTVSLADEVGAVSPLFNLDDLVAQMDSRDLYKIARIVTFQDPIAARAMIDMAVYDTVTEGPFRKNTQYFLDPTDRQARAYALDLAEEVCAAGFDEIQFDYVRFPDGFPETARFDHGSSPEVRKEAVTGFLREATNRLHPLGCLVAADIFGFITSVKGDGGIGQEFDALSEAVDVVSPMVYPSHYSTGWFGFDRPNDHPGEVVGQALDAGIRRRQSSAIVRPWLQDFYYEPSQVREQIEAAEVRSLGWMLWNARSRFQLDAIDADSPPAVPAEAGKGAGVETAGPSGS